jgi:hypothetical protein
VVWSFPVTVCAVPDVVTSVGVAGAVSFDATVTVGDAADVIVSAVVALSVTWSSNL